MSEVSVIPSVAGIQSATLADYLAALDRIAETQDAEAAQAAVIHAFNIAWYSGISRIAIVRSIAARLPAPTYWQADKTALLRDEVNHLLLTRPIGAFGDDVLFIIPGETPAHPPAVLIRPTTPEPAKIPDWDITNPRTRRIWKPTLEETS